MIKALWHKYRTPALWVTAALLLPLWYLLYYEPQLRHDKELAVQAETVRARIDAVQTRLRLAGAVTADLKRGRNTWVELSDNLVAPDQVDRLVSRLRNLAADYHLTVLNTKVDFDPLLDKVNRGDRIETVDIIGVQVEGRGRYFGIGDFIDSLDHQQVVAGVDDLELTYQSAADPEIYFQMSLSMFILPEPLEVP